MKEIPINNIFTTIVPAIRKADIASSRFLSTQNDFLNPQIWSPDMNKLAIKKTSP